MKKLKNNKAITLIALIITIVVLLILAVVAINSVQDGGILAHAKSAQQTYKEAADNETTKLQNYTDYLAYYSGRENGNNSETTTGWVQNGDGSKDNPELADITFTKGEQKVTLGDYVNYESGVSGYTHANGWKVLGVENGQLLLVSESNVNYDSFTLRGADGYLNGVKYLNDACESYGHGKGAVGARSIKIEDINRITGYDPTTYSGYGDIHEYKREGDTLYHKVNGVQQGNGMIMGEDCPLNFNLPDGTGLGSEWKELKDTCYYYSNPLISRMFSGDSFFIASPYVDAGGYFVSAGMRRVSVNSVIDGFLWYSYDDHEREGISNGVRAVVSLKSDVNLVANGANSWNIQ